jgi:hypothetical protein
MHSHRIPMVGALRRHDRLHERNALNSLAVAVGPVEPERRAPVMDNQGDPLPHVEGFEQGVEVAPMLDKAIRAGAAIRRLVRIAHADQVRRDAAA